MKLLLLGSKESGKSTVVEQMKIIGDLFHFRQEREQFKFLIYWNIMQAMITIICTMDQLRISFGQEECAEDVRKLFTLAENYSYSSHKSGDHSHEFALIMKRLWSDLGVQEGFAQSRDNPLIDLAQYYLNHIDRICQDDYIPSEDDVLQALHEQNYGSYRNKCLFRRGLLKDI